MARVFIGIGANKGDRLRTISRAVSRLGDVPEWALVQIATIVETEPVGGPPQGPYLNTVAEISTTQSPRELLTRLKQIERELGRTPAPTRWGPRVIDLDLLLYDERVIQEPDLVIPHPRMHERAFVLEPLAQLAPDVIHPVLQRPIAALREQVVASKPCG